MPPGFCYADVRRQGCGPFVAFMQDEGPPRVNWLTRVRRARLINRDNLRVAVRNSSAVSNSQRTIPAVAVYRPGLVRCACYTSALRLRRLLVLLVLVLLLVLLFLPLPPLLPPCPLPILPSLPRGGAKRKSICGRISANDGRCLGSACHIRESKACACTGRASERAKDTTMHKKRSIRHKRPQPKS